jgi:phospho-N-acetylmuramoyl-pentapeptide-transferase
MSMLSLDPIKVLFPAIISFLFGILVAPTVIRVLEHFKVWKKKSVSKTIDGKEASITATLHNDEERHLLRMGGIVVWLSVFVTAIVVWLLSKLHPTLLTEKLDFISRKQTWLPLMGMLVGACVGGLDDLLVSRVFKQVGSYVGGGLSFPVRLFAVSSMGLFAGLWFYTKLGVSSVYVPFYGDLHLSGLIFILFFVIVTVALFSTSVIDGIDGLSGGIFSAIFSAYGAIAFTQHQIDISALCFVIAGAIMAFLWFNIPPASFMMGETGIMAILLALSVIVFLTNAVLYLLVIAFPLIVTTSSVILQLFWKKFFKKKLFLVAPLHHHFEAKGWPRYRIVMRYWVVSYMCAILGVVLTLIS